MRLLILSRGAFALMVMLFMTAPAQAQSPYVLGSVGVDVSRLDRAEGAGLSDATPDGEAIAFSLRIGTAVGDRWGVELAFTRPDEIAAESRQGYPIPLETAASGLPPNAASSAVAIAFPVFESEIRLRRRNSTLDTVAWVSQPAGARAELVYLAGLAFARTTETIEFAFSRRPIGLIVPTSTRTRVFGVGPVVGVEGRIRLTDHVMLVPGLRLQTTGGNDGRDGWLMRASTGLGWRF